MALRRVPRWFRLRSIFEPHIARTATMWMARSWNATWGDRDHSALQREILFVLAARYPQLRKHVFPEQRVRVSPSRFRIPDICILRAGAPYEKAAETPPELCIEILSPEDRPHTSRRACQSAG
ncbi:MAG: Uma2 family endonuclease [Acidobacteriota bacterium]|nr:Uma2 family endonuclease [Acidobacteriota bacterium]